MTKHPRATAAKATTTAATAVALFLVACAGSDPTAEEVYEDVNSDVTTCEAGAYRTGAGTFTTCSKPCAELAPAVETNAACAAMCELNSVYACDPSRVVEIDGYIGVCGALYGRDTVEWLPCGGE